MIEDDVKFISGLYLMEIKPNIEMFKTMKELDWSRIVPSCSNSKKTGGGKDDKKNPSSKEESPIGKDDGAGSSSTGSNGLPSAEPSQPGSKPGSAGATAREGAQRLLGLATRSEWAPVDQLLKTMEKAMQSAGDDGNPAPLAGVMDPTTGMTPLMYAVKDNRTALIDRLIELGADVCARNNDNYNALHIAAMYSREDVVKLLLSKRGVDPYAAGGPKQQTAVHLVASRQTGTATSILRALLNAAGRDIRLIVDGLNLIGDEKLSANDFIVSKTKLENYPKV
ncbi:hypothetical protein PV328_004625 [Microctonus aethiopoides]|uniref:Uncharacterized protein n=1 Tax=Microctonus aethiopoides TaxID=144406 RepID=A0AA39FB08_9HYME|nr:hypothetical protein PV328_004625 [Microctonus aethiopoides]